MPPAVAEFFVFALLLFYYILWYTYIRKRIGKGGEIMFTKELIKRYFLLIVGEFFIGLGIAVSKRSDLGISPISSVANVLSLRFDFFRVGTWLMLWNCLFILIQIAILRKSFKPIQLLQFPVSLLLGVFTDVGVAMVSYISAESYSERLSLVLVGMVLISLGITACVISDTIMNVCESFVNVIAKAYNKSFGGIKVLFDVGCVATSVILSLIFFNGTVVGTREGTLITACLTGFVVKWMTKKLKDPLTKWLKK